MRGGQRSRSVWIPTSWPSKPMPARRLCEPCLSRQRESIRTRLAGPCLTLNNLNNAFFQIPVGPRGPGTGELCGRCYPTAFRRRKRAHSHRSPSASESLRRAELHLYNHKSCPLTGRLFCFFCVTCYAPYPKDASLVPLCVRRDLRVI